MNERQVVSAKADIEAVKLGGGSRTVVYFVESQPLFFDPTGREEWVPTGAGARPERVWTRELDQAWV